MTRSAAAQAHGITVMCHSGGASIPGSKPITPDHLLHLAPDVCGHINGGPTSLPAAGVDRIIEETSMALQLVQAGNLRSSLSDPRARPSTKAASHRLVIGSDTPTGTGVMPLGVIKTVAELASFSGIDPAMIWAAATGNNARVWDLPAGFIEVGRAADLVVMDAPWGSTRDDALGALQRRRHPWHHGRHHRGRTPQPDQSQHPPSGTAGHRQPRHVPIWLSPATDAARPTARPRPFRRAIMAYQLPSAGEVPGIRQLPHRGPGDLGLRRRRGCGRPRQETPSEDLRAKAEASVRGCPAHAITLEDVSP